MTTRNVTTANNMAVIITTKPTETIKRRRRTSRCSTTLPSPAAAAAVLLLVAGPARWWLQQRQRSVPTKKKAPAAVAVAVGSYYDVYPNVLVLGQWVAAASIAEYTLLSSLNACGPVRYTGVVDTSESSDSGDYDKGDGDEKVVRPGDPDWVEMTSTQFLFDWESFKRERDDEANTTTDLDVLRDYLFYYQHCRSGDKDGKLKDVRIEATGDDFNIPDTVRKVYDLLGDEEHPVRIFVMLPMFAIQSVLSRNFATMEDLRRQNNDGYWEPFAHCVTHMEDFYKYGLVEAKEACKSLGSYWRQIFPGHRQVVFIPCEFLQQNLTYFRQWWKGTLGLQEKPSKAPPPKPLSELEPPYSLDGDVTTGEEDGGGGGGGRNKASVVRASTWVGSYSNQSMDEQSYWPKSCAPFVTHLIRGNVTRQVEKSTAGGADGDASAIPMPPPKAKENPPTSLLLRSRTDLLGISVADDPVEARSGYYYMEPMNRDGEVLYRYYSHNSINLEFRKNSMGTYNINGSHDDGWAGLTIRGVLGTVHGGGEEHVTWNVVFVDRRS